MFVIVKTAGLAAYVKPLNGREFGPTTSGSCYVLEILKF